MTHKTVWELERNSQTDHTVLFHFSCMQWVWTRCFFIYFFIQDLVAYFFPQASAELTWAQAVTDANSFTSTSPAALQGVCAQTRMCVRLPSVGLQWIILLRRDTSCSPCLHKAWHCHSNNPPTETPSVAAVTAVPYPKGMVRGMGQQRARGRREDLKWVGMCKDTEWKCWEGERQTDGGKSKSALEWQKVEERKRERFILLGCTLLSWYPWHSI